ncbi:hypothetical protein RA280_24820, partial [Cupriavidus sp. CV2]|uniref:hypothetical protein n=1 Tax=Cupriavidus ulmosensis TaxID=3065913 RepID=UPI00296A982A
MFGSLFLWAALVFAPKSRTQPGVSGFLCARLKTCLPGRLPGRQAFDPISAMGLCEAILVEDRE